MPPLTPMQDAMLPIVWGAFELPATEGAPWDALRRDDPDELAALLAGEPESMVAIRAARSLRAHGRMVEPARAYGVLLVVPLDEWTDLLATYADGAVRYYNGAPPDGAGTVIDGAAAAPAAVAAAAVALLAAGERALSVVEAREVPVPVVDVGGPLGVLFASDGERLARLDALPQGQEMLAAGAALLQELSALG